MYKVNGEVVSLDEKKEAFTLICLLHTLIVDKFLISLAHCFMFLNQDICFCSCFHFSTE